MDVIKVIKDAWSNNVDKMEGKFIKGKCYPVILRNNEKEVRAAMFKNSGAGPIKIKLLRDSKYGQYFAYYKIKGDNLEEIGDSFLCGLSDEAREIHLKEFNDLFNS